MSIVILAEKPSQGRAYADAFRNAIKKDGYIEVEDSRFFNKRVFITWGLGHLVELVEPEQYKGEWKRWSMQTLPIFPEHFKFQVAKDKRKQFALVKKLLHSSSGVIVATDCDREGENIARSIILLAGAWKKPTKRLWINSLEVEEIQRGFQNLKEGHDYISLYREAQTRQFSDWLVGMNASRLYTLLLQQKGVRGPFSVGRVQTPTLYLIYKRHQEIENFKSEPFFEWIGDTTVKNGQFEAKHKEKFKSKEEAQAVIDKHNVVPGENKGVIDRIQKALKKTKSPRLHSLSTLQAKANKLWKYSPSETLKTAQGLYEKKLISYPRTDTHFITENEFNYLKEHLSDYQSCAGVTLELAYLYPQRRFVDGRKVQEHYAIIPTRKTMNLNALSVKERNIYREVLLTTLAMFAPDYEYEETKVAVDVNKMIFEKTGKVELKKGWKVLFGKEEPKTDSKKEEDAALPQMKEGESCTVNVKLKEGMTQPPKPFTEGHLIQVMKNAGKDVEDEEAKEMLNKTEGIGTEATRAAIIETLKHQKYIEVKKNIVHITNKGETLCQAVEGTLLSSPEMTGKWEQYLHKIGQSEGTQEVFIQQIEKFIQSLLESAPSSVGQLDVQVKDKVQSSFMGTCPVCRSGRVQDKGKFYGCAEYQEGCVFTLPKTFCGKKLSEAMIRKLLNSGKTGLLKGFKSKKGKSFEAYLQIENGKLTFEFPGRK
ncbi:type IA DNA topoisomerase [Siminovitchia terrae]|uniref:type IA DNA topoisomerase n=1 Tax=Siminovitchia terrae TaxID=1914933 RepID=UPI0035E43785